MAGLTLDAGALIAAERRDRRFWTFWKEAVLRDVDVTIPAGVLARAWRGNAPVVARILRASVVEALDEEMARRIGELLAISATSDVVDASVVLGAARRRDAVLTSDPDDLRRLVGCMDGKVDIIAT